MVEVTFPSLMDLSSMDVVPMPTHSLLIKVYKNFKQLVYLKADAIVDVSIIWMNNFMLNYEVFDFFVQARHTDSGFQMWVSQLQSISESKVIK